MTVFTRATPEDMTIFNAAIAAIPDANNGFTLDAFADAALELMPPGSTITQAEALFRRCNRPRDDAITVDVPNGVHPNVIRAMADLYRDQFDDDDVVRLTAIHYGTMSPERTRAALVAANLQCAADLTAEAEALRQFVEGRGKAGELHH
ncbi:hypothetical protein GOA97_18980 [Sinorhizobium meliloti]|nr:hypothetical protein [Sinorhizobium meliloti]MDW9656544.1 hypothetical protein [Sinorhizobium meliloti]MDW9916354.1 hypothetical protein [Sinorhizobium meliloti]MDW9939657.1 hypothetical protein [Sinorhizobium meliloti]MDW9945886.1 hypothetical protein [Sinorhizobium meliloti]